MQDRGRVEELLVSAESADEVELRAIMDELADIAYEAEGADPDTASDMEDLARAVYAFADWQFGGYEDRDETTRVVVGRQLWSEVSDRVREITGSPPQAPAFGASKHDA